MLEKVLPAFQVKVLKWTGDSGSNPEQAWFRKIPLAVNNINRGNSKCVWVQVRHSRAWDWTQHLSAVKLVGVLQLGVSEFNTRLLHFWGHNWFGMNASGQHTYMFIYCKFEATDLINLIRFSFPKSSIQPMGFPWIWVPASRINSV
jgi:hypothetical protein